MGTVTRYSFALCLLAGCVDGFKGSNVQFDFKSGTPVQASSYAAAKPGQLPANSSLALYALDESTSQTSLFEIQRFEIHRIVDLASPCYIDVGEHVPHPGLHVSQFATVIAKDDGIPDVQNPPASSTMEQQEEVATAEQRMINVAKYASNAGLEVITSASPATYPAVDADCNGSGLPPPMCTDDASNARRLAACQAAWAADPALYEGTDRVLVSPLAGTAYGMVDGVNPVNLGAVGGAQFFVDTNLVDFSAYAIYQRTDGDTGTGSLLYYGKVKPDVVRGVTHAQLVNQTDSTLTVELAIFDDLGNDDVSF